MSLLINNSLLGVKHYSGVPLVIDSFGTDHTPNPFYTAVFNNIPLPGDLVICFVACNASAPDSVPSGFSLLNSYSTGLNFIGCYYWFADGVRNSFTFGNSAGSVYLTAYNIRYAGAFKFSAYTNNTSATSCNLAPSAQSASAGSLILGAGYVNSAASGGSLTYLTENVVSNHATSAPTRRFMSGCKTQLTANSVNSVFSWTTSRGSMGILIGIDSQL